jgi:hypothetical protein
MAGCGALSAVSGIPGSNHGRQRRNGPRCPLQVPPPSRPSREVAAAGGHPPLARRPAGTILVGVSAHRSTRPAAGHHGGRASAPAQPLQMAGVRHVCRCPPADRPADMTVEAAAEGPQRFPPGGGTGTGCRTPDRSGPHPAWTPRPPAGRPGRKQDRTPEAADGQSVDRSARYNFLYAFSRPALRAAACGGRPRPATTRRSPWDRPHPPHRPEPEQSIAVLDAGASGHAVPGGVQTCGVAMISAATSMSLRDEERAMWRRTWNACKEGSPLRSISTPLACSMTTRRSRAV